MGANAAGRFTTITMLLFYSLLFAAISSSTVREQLSFSANEYHVNISENTKIGQSILQLSVLNSSPSLIYHLITLPNNNNNNNNNNNEQLVASNDFFLSPNGSLQISRPLSRQRTLFYALTISVSDISGSYQATFTRVTVNVLDFPGNYPVFSQTNYRISLSETQSTGETFYSVQAITKDSIPLDYELIGGDNNYQHFFRLDRKTGGLSLLKSLSYSYTNNYRLVVRASSSYNSRISTDAVINISLSRSSIWNFTQDNFSFAIPNGVALGSVFGYVFLSGCNITDSSIAPSLPSVNFTTESDQLSVDPLTGGLSLTSSLSSGPAIAIVMATTIEGEVSTTQVMVSSSTENSVSSLEQNYVFEINDDLMIGEEERSNGGVVIGTVDGGDWNNLKILAGNCQDIFSINQTSGELSINYTPYPGTYHLTVGVTCNRLLVPIWVQVRVNNVNAAPKFDRDIYQVLVFSNISVGDTITQLVINDTDTGINNSSYQITSTNLPSSLSLTPQGLLLVKEQLQGNVILNFTVTAKDSGSPPLSSSARVIINIINVDPPPKLAPPTSIAPPTFKQSEYEGSIFENEAPGTLILSLTITSNYAIKYWLSGPQESLTHFTITPLGHLVTICSIDRERYSTLTLQVHATYLQANNNNNQLSSSVATVRVNIKDRIDTPPTFLTPDNYTLYLTTPVSANTNILTIQAITQDNTTGNILYTLTNTTSIGSTTSMGSFAINTHTGQLIVNTSLISVGVYKLRISASMNNLFTLISINVVVMDTSPAPFVNPSTLYVSTFSYLLPSVFRLSDLRSSNGGRVMLGPSPCDASKYFQLNGSGLYLMNTITSGEYNLNVSIAGTNEGVWFQRNIKVRVNLLTNHTLDHTLFIVIPNLSREHFLEHFMSKFRSSFVSILKCRHDCLDIVTIQGSGRGIKVGVAVRKLDLVSYYSIDYLRTFLKPFERELSSLLKWTLYVDNDDCSEVKCAGFKKCNPFIRVSLPHSSLLTSSSFSLTLPSSSSHTCTCPPGYSSDCTYELNECSTNPCLYSAKCIDLLNDYYCDCPLYTSGKNCSSVCPAQSTCMLCSPNPCLNGGKCEVQGGQEVCRQCPSGFSGKLCELTTAHFESGRGYVSLPSLERRKEVELSFDFVGVQPNALLLYTGQFNSGNDYIRIDISLGVVRVSVMWGNWSTTGTISNDIGVLNDGQWRTVKMILNTTAMTVDLSNCVKGNIIIDRAITSCSLIVPVHTSSRSLQLDSPLYVYGLPTTFLPPVSQNPSVRFGGCLRNVIINRKTIDFANVQRYDDKLVSGCRQTSQTGCNDCGGGATCVQLWNGSRCERGQGSPISLNGTSKYDINLSNLKINNISLQIRTRQDNARILNFDNNRGSLDIFYGSIVFRYFPATPLSPVTLVAHAHIHDGNWHTITLSLTPTQTRLSIDEGRIVAVSNTNITIATDRISLSTPGILIKEKFDGCVKLFSINSLLVNNFNVTSNNVTSGCHGNDPCSNTSLCPANSECQAGWRSFTCSCVFRYFPNQYSCDLACGGNACNGNTCNFDSGEPDGHTCVCGAPHLGLECEIDPRVRCPLGLYREHERCLPCTCDSKGVTNTICDSYNGTCHCNPSIPTYSPSHELSCKVCNCNHIGSTSLQCNSSGKCTCKPGVGGDRCDRCLTGYVQFGSNGCKKVTLVSGSFVMENLYYFTEDSSSLRTMITNEVLTQLRRFVLPTNLELSLTLYNSSSMTGVNFHLTSTNNNITSHLLASILQTVLNDRGCLGRYIVLKNSYKFEANCQSTSTICDPLATCNDTTSAIQCTDCPTGTVGDGVICRTILTQNCSGRSDDTDYDGVPDTCDTCPYWFNPRQDVTSGCVTREGVCPREKYMGVIWSMRQSGENDVQSCPSPLTGTATRGCGHDGRWEEPDYRNCTSFTGQQMMTILQDVMTSPPSTHNQTTQLVQQVSTLLSSSPSLYCADLLTTLNLVNNITNLSTLLPIQENTNLKPLINTLGVLSSSRLSNEWLKPGCGNAGSLLNIADVLSTLSTDSVDINSMMSLQTNAVSVMYSKYSGDRYSGVEFSVSADNGVAIPEGVIAKSNSDIISVSLSSFSDLTSSLPRTTLTNVTLGSPVWSISLVVNGRSVTKLATPINITFPHPQEVTIDSSSSTAVCVVWNTTRSVWESAGCTSRDTGRNSTVCSCPHLSHFTLAFTPFEPTDSPTSSPVEQEDLHLLFYIANGCSFSLIIILIVVIFVSIRCNNPPDQSNRSIKSWLQLLFALLFLYFLFFLTDRTEIQSACNFIGILMEYVSLVVGALFVMVLLIALFNVYDKLTSGWTLAILSGLAWVLPAVYVGINLIIIHFVYTNLSDGYGYPQLCWIDASISFLLYAPMILLFAVSILLILILLSLHFCSSQTSTHKYSTLFLTFLFLFFLFNYTTTVLTIHSTEWTPLYWQLILGALVIATCIISSLILPILLFQARLKDFIVVNFTDNMSEEKETRTCKKQTSQIPLTSYYTNEGEETEHHLSTSVGTCDPVYQTIPNVGEGGEQLYLHPMHCIEATNNTNNLRESGGSDKIDDTSLHNDDSSSDDSSDHDSDVDIQTLNRPTSSRSAQLATPSNVEGGGAWFDDLESNLCSPMTPPTYAESPHPPVEVRTNNHENIVHDEIDRLYEQTRICAAAHSPSDQGGGDYVELKNKDEPSKISEPWYEEPESIMSRKKAQEATPLAPPLYSTISSLEDQFDDANYSMVHTPKQNTPTKRMTSKGVAQSMTHVPSVRPLNPTALINSMSKINTSTNSQAIPPPHRRTSVQPHKTTPPSSHGPVARRHSSQATSKPHPHLVRDSLSNELHHNGVGGSQTLV